MDLMGPTLASNTTIREGARLSAGPGLLEMSDPEGWRLPPRPAGGDIGAEPRLRERDYCRSRDRCLPGGRRRALGHRRSGAGLDVLVARGVPELAAWRSHSSVRAARLSQHPSASGLSRRRPYYVGRAALLPDERPRTREWPSTVPASLDAAAGPARTLLLAAVHGGASEADPDLRERDSRRGGRVTTRVAAAYAGR